MRRAFFALALLAAAPALAKPPVWDRKIESPKRFKVLKAFDSAAVLDQETGLLWERAPGSDIFSWASAFGYCTRLMIGGRGGWRLPTIYELRTLVPYELQALPEGHPFAVSTNILWSSTSVAESDANAYTIDLSIEDNNIESAGKAGPFPAWCVRGGVGGSTD